MDLFTWSRLINIQQESETPKIEHRADQLVHCVYERNYPVPLVRIELFTRITKKVQPGPRFKFLSPKRNFDKLTWRLPRLRCFRPKRIVLFVGNIYECFQKPAFGSQPVNRESLSRGAVNPVLHSLLSQPSLP